MPLLPGIRDAIPNASDPTPGWGLTLGLDGKLPLAVQKTLPGYRYCHKEFTSNVSITHTTEAAADVVVTAPDVVLDGSTPIFVSFFTPLARVSSVAAISFWCYDGSTSLGLHGQLDVTAANTGSPVTLGRDLTLAAGTHSLSIRASVAAGTGTVFAASGGAGNAVPGYIRIVRS